MNGYPCILAWFVKPLAVLKISCHVIDKIFCRFKSGNEEDLDIEQKAGAPNVFCIPIIAGGNASVIRSWPMMTFHLGKTSDARPHQVSEFIFRDHERKAGPVRKHVRPWTNDTHVTDKYVYELRQFIQISFS